MNQRLLSDLVCCRQPVLKKFAVAAAAAFALAVAASAACAQTPPLAALAAALAAGHGSSSPGGAVVFPVGDLRAQLAGYISDAKAKGSAGTTLEDYGACRLELSVLGKSGYAEVHAHWDDIMIVEQGSANLITGGRVIGAHAGPDGEVRGIKIEGGQTQSIAAGDVIAVRAGTPQQLLLAPGTVFSAFVIGIHEP